MLQLLVQLFKMIIDHHMRIENKQRIENKELAKTRECTLLTVVADIL